MGAGLPVEPGDIAFKVIHPFSLLLLLLLLLLVQWSPPPLVVQLCDAGCSLHDCDVSPGRQEL